MIGSIRRHSSVLWWIIVVGVIVSFVIMFAPNQPSFRSVFGSAPTFGTIYGRPIKQEEIVEAGRQARFAMSGQRQLGQDAEEMMTYRVLLINEKLRQLGIIPGEEQVAEYLKQHLRDPTTGRLQYDEIIGTVKARGFTEADYIAAVRREIGQRHLINLVGMPSQLVTPREAEAEFRRENEQAVAGAVFFSSSNFLAGVQIDAQALGQFYTNRIANYRSPEKLTVTYAKFGTNDFLAKAGEQVSTMPDLAARLEAAYNQRQPGTLLDSLGNPLPRDAALARVREETIHSVAISLAAEQANAFYNDLGTNEPVRPENLRTLAEKRGLKVEVTPEFPVNERPPGLEGLRNLGQQLVQLDPASPFTEPLPAPDGVYILTVTKREPAKSLPLDSVRARVVEDFRRAQALDAARTAGQTFRNVATNALAAGKTFDALVAEQKLTAVDLPPFSLSLSSVPGLPPQADLGSLKDAAFAIQPGQVSGFIPGRDGGCVLYLRERRPASEELVKTELPGYLSEIRQREEGRGFSEWLSHEFAVSGLKDRLEPRQKMIDAPGQQTP